MVIEWHCSEGKITKAQLGTSIWSAFLGSTSDIRCAVRLKKLPWPPFEAKFILGLSVKETEKGLKNRPRLAFWENKDTQQYGVESKRQAGLHFFSWHVLWRYSRVKQNRSLFTTFYSVLRGSLENITLPPSFFLTWPRWVLFSSFLMLYLLWKFCRLLHFAHSNNRKWTDNLFINEGSLTECLIIKYMMGCVAHIW